MIEMKQDQEDLYEPRNPIPWDKWFKAHRAWEKFCEKVRKKYGDPFLRKI